jgi:hypothetical protein
MALELEKFKQLKTAFEEAVSAACEDVGLKYADGKIDFPGHTEDSKPSEVYRAWQSCARFMSTVSAAQKIMEDKPEMDIRPLLQPILNNKDELEKDWKPYIDNSNSPAHNMVMKAKDILAYVVQ